MHRNLSVSLLVVAYAILVVIVVFGAFFIHKEFDDAENERCQILGIQVELAYTQIQVYKEAKPPVELSPAAQAAIDKLATDIAATCPEIGDI